MPRLKTVDPAKAAGPAKELLDAVQGKMGRVPNIFRAMANSPAALGAYLGFADGLSRTGLGAPLREQIALAVSQASGCDYCIAAHTALGRAAGLTDEQMLTARRGGGTDARATAALTLARKIVQSRGDLTDADVAHARKAGLDDAALVEVLAVAVQNLFTNYFNHLNGTDPDFPPAPKLS